MTGTTRLHDVLKKHEDFTIKFLVVINFFFMTLQNRYNIYSMFFFKKGFWMDRNSLNQFIFTLGIYIMNFAGSGMFLAPLNLKDTGNIGPGPLLKDGQIKFAQVKIPPFISAILIHRATLGDMMPHLIFWLSKVSLPQTPWLDLSQSFDLVIPLRVLIFPWPLRCLSTLVDMQLLILHDKDRIATLEDAASGRDGT